MEEAIKVDALVVDSTYGAPEKVRHYSQGDCEEIFVGTVRRLLQEGPIHLVAHRGTLERSLQLLNGEIDAPLVGSWRVCRLPRFTGGMGIPSTRSWKETRMLESRLSKRRLTSVSIALGTHGQLM